MELEKIRNLTDEELTSQQTKAAEQLFRIRFAKSLGKQEGLKNLRTLKLDIARIKTDRSRAHARRRQGRIAGSQVAAAPAASTRTARKKKAKKD